MTQECCFQPFLFASFSAVDDRHIRGFSKAPLPHWRTVYPGLNLEGVCKNKKCDAYNHKVWSPLKYGQFHLQQEVKNTRCVACSKKLKKVQCAGLYKCNLIGKGLKAEKDGNQTDQEDDKGDKTTTINQADEQQEQEQVHFEYLSNNQQNFLKFGDLEKEVVLWHYLILNSHLPDCNCPEKHGLSEYQVVGSPWICDNCQKHFQSTKKAKSCRQCDYDICLDCLK